MSIRQLKAIHTATHPGRPAQAGLHALESEPVVGNILAQLDREAEENAEE